MNLLLTKLAQLSFILWRNTNIFLKFCILFSSVILSFVVTAVLLRNFCPWQPCFDILLSSWSDPNGFWIFFLLLPLPLLFASLLVFLLILWCWIIISNYICQPLDISFVMVGVSWCESQFLVKNYFDKSRLLLLLIT